MWVLVSGCHLHCLEIAVNSFRPFRLPRGVALFVLVHALSVSLLWLAAARVGEHYEHFGTVDSHHMRLVPLNQIGTSPR